MWCKSGNWTRLYYLLVIENETCYIQLLSGLINFRSISIKPYFRLETAYNTKLDELEATAELDKLKAPAKLDKLKVPAKLNKLKALLPTLKVP